MSLMCQRLPVYLNGITLKEKNMLKKKSIGLALLGALALGASGAALANPITVDGIQFNSGAVFQSAQLYETQVSSTTSPGNVLSGYGMINSINGNTNYCAGGGFDCQLTFTFTGYTATTLTDSTAVFTGGTITFYASNSRTFDPSNPASATAGSVFLVTDGHTFQDNVSGNTGTLISNATVGNFLTSQFQGHGSGLLDVMSGDAASYFNTNTFTDNLGGLADIQFISDFSPNGCENSGNSAPYVICGSGSAKSFAMLPVSVPEPAELGLLGFGLGAMGFFMWRRRKENEGRA